MSLGVLNNLSAITAANNLNKTSNSLSTVLNQLSSGSKINSGADDAAGLSLVDGLEANSTALSQSETNASEGVGLLTVADGALSQVTSLLNRAVTLATEAGNGTLNSSQESAANDEYQSILSEINNIGLTTTYNQNTVFTGSSTGVNIYTGDSSSNGASIDSLYFASLSSSSVGDSGGSINYSSGQANQFFDLTNSTTDATYSQAMAGGSLSFNYLLADGTTHATATVTVTTSDTVSSVIDKINNLGIGVTATLSTASAAGASGTGTDTGIEISGNITSSAGQTKAGDTTITATTFYDTGSGQTSNVAGTVDSATGIAKITYTAGAGTNLKELGDLDSTSAQSILTALNSAITDVAAQDGYIGAQINTLDSINQVMSTQQENIESAQNAIQATDYASATSDMSKYEVLTQTGIAALAQANSVQQEVTKLLQ